MLNNPKQRQVGKTPVIYRAKNPQYGTAKTMLL